MGETLEALHQLQQIETQLAAIRRKSEAKQRQIEIQQRRAREAEERLLANQRAIRDRQIRVDTVSLEVASRDEAIAKQREALSKARTNKAYADILTAINTSKANNSKLESSILQLMEEIQTLQKEGATMESEKADLLAKAHAAEAQLQDHEEDCRDERERLEVARDECAENIPPTALAMFSRIAEHHDGEAMAHVVKLHPKREDYACTGCNMKITLEVVSTLQKNDELQICGCCGRVLYFEKAAVR